jgi:hypothetical protein
MIVTDEDINQLEVWAREMHERDARVMGMSKEHFNVLNIPIRIIPTKIEIGW